MDLSFRHCLIHNLKAVQTHSKRFSLTPSHPTVMWFQVITTLHLHRNLHKSLPGPKQESNKWLKCLIFFFSFFFYTLLTVEYFSRTFPFRVTKKQVDNTLRRQRKIPLAPLPYVCDLSSHVANPEHIFHLI